MATVNSSDENQGTQQKLRKTFGNVEVFEEEHDCRQFIQSKPKQQLALIVSGRLSRSMVPDIDQLEQIIAIYIYCMDKSRHEEWAEQFPKIKGIVVEPDQLINQMQFDQTMLIKKPDSTGKVSPTLTTNHADSSYKPVAKVNSGSSHAPTAAASGYKKTYPLAGYEKVPLVTLEEATTPLVELVPDVEQMVWIVKQNCQTPEDGLTSDESASVMLYTMEWFPKEKAFYYILNEALRSEDNQQLKPWFLYLKLAFRALSKLPSINHIVYRGVNSDISNDYSKGNVVVSWEFLICTTAMKTLENEETFGKTGQRTLFTIQCRSGKDIRRHSFEESKDQILLLPGRQFQVVSCLNPGDELNIIQLDELKSPYSLE